MNLILTDVTITISYFIDICLIFAYWKIWLETFTHDIDTISIIFYISFFFKRRKSIHEGLKSSFQILIVIVGALCSTDGGWFVTIMSVTQELRELIRQLRRNFQYILIYHALKKKCISLLCYLSLSLYLISQLE